MHAIHVTYRQLRSLLCNLAEFAMSISWYIYILAASEYINKCGRAERVIGVNSGTVSVI